MTPRIKFCGMTRSADVRLAAELGAAFVGAVFAGGPRLITAEHARRMFDGVAGVRRVGVFGDQTLDEIARAADLAALDVVQLHADPAPAFAAQVRRETGLETWVAVRISTALLSEVLDDLASSADAIVFDTRAPGSLGGTGRPFDWSLLADAFGGPHRGAAHIVLAGGLTPALVSDAITQVRPHVVDVSSGVESAPGIKDPALMRAFARAVHGVA